MDIFLIITVLLVLAAIFGYLNVRFLKMPNTIGLMIISIIFTLILIIAGSASDYIFEISNNFISRIDFKKALMDVMLSFLLFAGALHTDFKKLKQQRGPIIIFSTVGIVLSTFLIGTAFFYLINLIGLELKYIHALIFGALISPTDPIAVLGVLKEAKAPKKLEIKIVGESLFNDGIGVVVFLTLFNIASMGTGEVDAVEIIKLFAEEVIGGIALGGVIGYLAYLMMRSIDHYETEIMITLALVTGSYVLANALHFSGPLAVVVAGLFIGNRARQKAFSEQTEKYIDKFWEILDVLLNAILFVMIGIELLIITFDIEYLIAGFITIPVVLIARYIVLSLPIRFFKKRLDLMPKTCLIMTWGGLRGGISIALALTLTPDMNNELILTVTYAVVIFSIVVQGLSLKRMLQKLT